MEIKENKIEDIEEEINKKEDIMKKYREVKRKDEMSEEEWKNKRIEEETEKRIKNKKKMIKKQQQKMEDSFKELHNNLKYLSEYINLLKIQNTINSSKLLNIFFIGAIVAFLAMLNKNHSLFFYYFMLIGVQQFTNDKTYYKLTRDKKYLPKIVIMLIVIIVCIIKILNIF